LRSVDTLLKYQTLLASETVQKNAFHGFFNPEQKHRRRY